MKLSNFAEVHAALAAFLPDRLSRHAYTPDHIGEFLAAIGNPQDAVRVIHVAGTSGKTSTAYYAAALLRAAGHKVGLTVSPHVDEINERVQIDLVPLPEQQFCAELSTFLDIVEANHATLTYFELLVAFAFWEFARQKVDYAVVEVGIGGLADATNVITREDKVCVITDIGLDHQNVLGDTLGEIAAQKAGIIQLHNSVFCYQQASEIMAPIQKRAAQKRADLHLITATPSSALEALPLFQQRNLTLAQAAVAFLLDVQVETELLHAAATVRIPARMETFQYQGKTIILDGAHNAQKLTALRQSMAARYPDQPVAALVSFAARRGDRVETATAEIARMAEHIIVTSFGAASDGMPYSEDPAIIAAHCKSHGALQVSVVPRPERAFDTLLRSPEKILLVAGSFFLLNHIRPRLRELLASESPKG